MRGVCTYPHPEARALIAKRDAALARAEAAEGSLDYARTRAIFMEGEVKHLEAERDALRAAIREVLSSKVHYGREVLETALRALGEP